MVIENKSLKFKFGYLFVEDKYDSVIKEVPSSKYIHSGGLIWGR